jgi:transposase
MEHYAGIDVSLECSSVCVVDANGKIVREAKVASEPQALIAWVGSLGFGLERIGLEAGPLSQWLFAGMKGASLAVELLETRHVRKAFEAMPVKSDRNDARGIAQLMRLGWFRPVHCKSMSAQEIRSLLTARKLVQSKLLDVENSLRGILRGFGLKVGKTTKQTFAGRIEELVAGHPHLQMIAKALLAGASGAADRVRSLREADPQDGAIRHAGTAADLSPGGRPDRGANLCQRDRRSGPVQIVKAGRSPFRVDPEEASIRRDRLHRPDQQDR